MALQRLFLVKKKIDKSAQIQAFDSTRKKRVSNILQEPTNDEEWKNSRIYH